MVEQMQSTSSDKYSFVDLFCGAGGLSLGFQKAGFDHIAGYDNWELACKTYHANIGLAILADISKLEKVEEADVLIGSPPCQTFSNANIKTKTCDLTLTNSFMRLVAKMKPKIWIMENVPAIFNAVDVPFKKVFDMSKYGMLQQRKRCICSNIALEIEETKNKFLNEAQTKSLLEFRKEAIHRRYQTLTCRYNSCSHTNPHLIDGGKIRVLNHKEALAIQTFPFYFQMPDNATQRETETLVGNAVPPAFAYLIGNYVKDYLDKNEGKVVTNISNILDLRI